ncbi:MAG: phenylalanine--tRNA ligase subunit beta, partial [Anaerolineales bacterium]|nr:phenylalanine--tRNA ligase subunit beta [Anaerolineales bacterium]
PEEPGRLVIALTGPRALPTWQGSDQTPFDFYDMKGILSTLLNGLHITDLRFEPGQRPTFHPGKCGQVIVGGKIVGFFGEIHPLVKERLDVNEFPILVADFDLDMIIDSIPERYNVQPVPVYPPVLEDLAIVVDEDLPAARVESTIRKAAKDIVTAVQLFDVYRGESIGQGKKSLAYAITYQAPDRTLTDNEVARIRQRIIQMLNVEINARIRSLNET